MMIAGRKDKGRDADHFATGDVVIAELIEQARLITATEYMYESVPKSEGVPVLDVTLVPFEEQSRRPVCHASLSFIGCNRAVNMLIIWLGPVTAVDSLWYDRAS